VRTSLPASRPAVAVAVLSAAILGTTAACGTSASSTSATSNTTATAAAAKPSGNPLAGLTADQIASKATADLKAVSSVHMTGSVTDSGQAYVMNLVMGTKGCHGTLSVKGEGSFRLLQIGKKLWIKPDNQFWKYAAGSSAAPAVMQIVGGKYIRPSAKDTSLNSLGALCSPSQFASSFEGQMSGMVKGKTTTISGQPALQIKDTGDPYSAYVTISARPEFLRFDGGSSRNRLNFTGYNAPLRLTPPPASETLDGAKYGF
jgi:hypothetical protein